MGSLDGLRACVEPMGLVLRHVHFAMTSGDHPPTGGIHAVHAQAKERGKGDRASRGTSQVARCKVVVYKLGV